MARGRLRFSVTMWAKTLAVLSLLAQVVVAANSSSPYVNPAQNGGKQLTVRGVVDRSSKKSH